MSEFNFLEIFPLFIFSLAFFIIFILLLWGGFLLLSAKGDDWKTEKGKKLLLNSLYGLCIVLIIVSVFFLITYLLKKGEGLTPSEFPPSPAANFPPPPQFIEIGKYYFTGPLPLKENDLIGKPAIYTILCKKNQEYDKIYIGETGGRIQLLEHGQYNCWMENCGKKLGNLYVAVFRPSEKYSSTERKRIREELEEQINPPCLVTE